MVGWLVRGSRQKGGLHRQKSGEGAGRDTVDRENFAVKKIRDRDQPRKLNKQKINYLVMISE